jgi:SAM-dependent methyltransferase
MRDQNLLSYDNARVASQYANGSDALSLSEEKALSFMPMERRRSVLDMGVGAGRTSRALSTMFSEYVGADYAPEMVEAATRRFPHLRFVVMDAREITYCERYDCIFFSFNGIDSVTPPDRARIFVSARDALTDGGMFIYSTHNILSARVEYYRRSFFIRELFDPLWKPHRVARRLLNRASRFWRCGQDYPYFGVNDPGDDFGHINVYADISAELDLLPQYGFSLVAALGGRSASMDFRNDPWVYIVARADRDWEPPPPAARLAHS